MQALPRRHPLRLAAAALLAALASSAAQAQYKVTGPDGKVTYTDRAPVAPGAKVSPIAAPEAPAPSAVLPPDLQQAATRYPVVLYVSGALCASCDGGRDLLRQRGIPYAEKQVLTGSDGAAFERLTGTRDVPALTIGAQTLRGLSADVWNSYLDAAGYPRSSRLPAGYQAAAPSPLTQRPEGLASRGNAPGEPATPLLPSTPATPPQPTAPASGIRF